MPVEKLQEFLEQHKISYKLIVHSEAFTAQEVAASAHIPGKDLAKTVVVKLDGEMVLVVLPASSRVDFQLLKEGAGVEKAELADEEEFRRKFPGCEIGAMPPFGNLFGMKVFVAETLTEDEVIAFNAGSHIELIQLSYKDFERLVKPNIVKFSRRAA